MPHISIEATANATDLVMERNLVDVLHQAALDCGSFPVYGIRTLLRPALRASVGNGLPDNAFIQINIRIAPGRSPALRQQIAQQLFDAAAQALDDVFARQALGLQLEITEFDADYTRSRTSLSNERGSSSIDGS